MDYKTIMVNLDIDDPVGERLGLACELAQWFDADLIGFVACEPYPELPASTAASWTARSFAIASRKSKVASTL